MMVVRYSINILYMSMYVNKYVCTTYMCVDMSNYYKYMISR